MRCTFALPINPPRPVAVLWDCDGTLADTERDAHRPAFNEAFKRKGIDCVWDVDLYGKLLETGGGKERMTAHWNKVGWPLGLDGNAAGQQALVKELHLLKTGLFNEAILSGSVPLRPGVLRLVDDLIAAGVPLAVCSTSNDKAVSNLVLTLMGKERFDMFRIYAGDIVQNKKPAPDVYNLARDEMGLDPSTVVVMEDSSIGLRSAKAANMACIVTTSSYTEREDFTGADLVVSDLEAGKVTLDVLSSLIRS